MNSFNVLDRQVNVHQSYLLEASAGTGKTFSIENIVVRLLIEDESGSCKTIDQILVVTFTRAAARDLKIRIRKTLENCLQVLNGKENTSPDYLLAILQQSQEKVEIAKKRLAQALGVFDKAQIYTIHRFCLVMLTTFVFESDFSLRSPQQEKNISKEDLFLLIRDFFRTKIHVEKYSPAQLQILLNAHDQSIEKLQDALLNFLNKDFLVPPTAPFCSDLKVFKTIMKDLKEKHGLIGEKLREDFEKQKEFYKVLKSKKTNLDYFFDLFDKNDWEEEDFDLMIQEGLYLPEFLSLDNAKKNKKLPSQASLNYPGFLAILSQDLAPLIARARNDAFIFARMLSDCQEFVQKYLRQEELYSENDLLKQMLQALENPQFINQIRHLYRAAIIDEFQDTDPMQWEIFQRLFMHTKCQIYLVGDPKQSIYAFRQADIYTYLSAANSLGKDHQASLDTNYRSQPSLVQGLNTLFKAASPLFALPATQNFLDFSIVKASSHVCEKTFKDSLESIHFFCATKPSKEGKNFPSETTEKECYFPFITQEIIRLHDSDLIRFNQCAILVKDRYQAHRLAEFLKLYQIPYALQKQSSLTESIAWNYFRELLQAVLHFKNESAVKIALGGGILQWNYQDIKKLEMENELEKVLAKFHHFKRKLNESFALFFSSLMQSCWHEDEKTVTERLLEQEDGVHFLDELNQIAHLLIEEQNEHPSSSERLIEFMDRCKTLSLEEEERLKKFSDPSSDAVSILTTYNSKGLEYDIVFALGLVNRTKAPSMLIPQKEGLQQYVTPCLDKNDELYIKYCEELDAEKMRQLYVAMTRAKYRLYVPALFDTKSTQPSFGTASPMELFLARIDKETKDYATLYQQISQNNYEALEKFIRTESDAHLSCSTLNEISFSLFKMQINQSRSLVPPPQVTIPGTPYFIHSFTSISKQKKSSTTPYFLFSPQTFDCSEKNPHQLPAGAATGKLLHKILEIIPFTSVQNISSALDLSPWIQPLIQENEFSSWQEVLCDITYHALRCPLQDDFYLAQVNQNQMYRETEFFYPCTKELKIEGLQWRNGFLKGVIDLIFCFRDRYYLIDWKSNWLGPTQESYSHEKMELAMRQHDYFFQAHIYKEALRRYLQVVDKRPFEQIYGGCFYVFLRGLSLDASTGIFKV